MATPEGKIQTVILKYLKEEGVFAWRQNNLAVYDPKIKAYRSHTGLKGVPDIICIINGRFTGLEVKAPKGKQSADQVLFQKRCERNGGYYAVVRSVDDVKDHLKRVA